MTFVLMCAKLSPIGPVVAKTDVLVLKANCRLLIFRMPTISNGFSVERIPIDFELPDRYKKYTYPVDIGNSTLKLLI